MSERWYVASKPGVAFAFCIESYRVTKVAPIARRWMQGREIEEVAARLKRNGYEVSRLP